MFKNQFKPKLLYLCYLMFGLSLSSTFLLSNLSSIFKFLGANDSSLPFLWLIPPITGIIIQPLIGQISDDTSTPYGKRRPFIVVFAALAALCFAVLGHIQSLTFAILIILIIDCTINGTVEAVRALTGDSTTSNQERSKVFALQAFFAGIGGSIGVSLPYLMECIFKYLNVYQTIAVNEIPASLRYALFITAFVLLGMVYLSVFYVREKPARTSLIQKKRKQRTLTDRMNKSLRDLYISLCKMPPAFRRVFYINGLTWTGIFTFWLYFTVCLAQTKYGLPLNADTQTDLKNMEIFHRATLGASYYFAIYQYASIAYVMFLYLMSNSNKIKLIHAVSLIIGGISMATLCYATSDLALLVAFIGISVLWGSLSVLPYSIVMQILPRGKVGVYLGIFNISITAPQIICGFVLSPLYLYVFQYHANQLMFFAGLMIVISGVLWGRLYLQEWMKTREQPGTFITRESVLLDK